MKRLILVINPGNVSTKIAVYDAYPMLVFRDRSGTRKRSCPGFPTSLRSEDSGWN